jgi:hypothetical protein
MQPKVLLEFLYPDDEDRLLFAIKGPEMYRALTNIKMAVTGGFNTKADLNAVLERVRDLTDQIFEELGE